MLGGLEALTATVLALLPGAAYTFSLETSLGSWGAGHGDRIYRFLVSSALLHLVLAPLTFNAWQAIEAGLGDASGRELLHLWGVLALLAAFPIVTGRVLGWGFLQEKPWAKAVLGTPQPSAWDYLWSNKGTAGYVRVRLKSGTWVGGAFDDRSFAAGYPHDPDILLAHCVEVHPDTGEWKMDGDRPVPRRSGILLRREDIELLEIVDG